MLTVKLLPCITIFFYCYILNIRLFHIMLSWVMTLLTGMWLPMYQSNVLPPSSWLQHWYPSFRLQCSVITEKWTVWIYTTVTASNRTNLLCSQNFQRVSSLCDSKLRNSMSYAWVVVCDKVHWHTLLVNLSKLISILAQVMTQNDLATEQNVIWETGPSALEEHTALVKVNQAGKVDR